jgi:hypothetical protein
MLVFSSIQWNHHHRYYPLYLFLFIACLLLGITNATNETVVNNDGLLDKVSTFATSLWKSINDGTNETSITTNETINVTEPSIFHKPENMSDVRRILSAILRVSAQIFLIVSLPYICDRYYIVKGKISS